MNFAAANCAMIGPMRAAAFALLLLPLAGCDVTLGEEREFEQALEWVNDFRARHPQVAGEIARQCAQERPPSPYQNRKDSLQLMDCIRARAAQRGLS